MVKIRNFVSQLSTPPPPSPISRPQKCSAMQKWMFILQWKQFHFSSAIFLHFLSFISANLNERLSRLKWYQRTPVQFFVLLSRYLPFRLEYWQYLYHQAPVHRMAQLLAEAPSLSLSFVVKLMLLWYIKESLEVPEYEPTWSRYCACSSPTLNLRYLAYNLFPYQSSSSTRRELDLDAVNLWILSFPSQNSPLSWPKPAL